MSTRQNRCRDFLISAGALSVALLAATPANAVHGITVSASSCVITNGTWQYCDNDSKTSSTVGQLGVDSVLGPQHSEVIQTYGVFHGSARAYLSENNAYGITEIASSGVSGQFQDTWTIAGGTGAAYLQRTYTVTGSTSSTANVPGYFADVGLDAYVDSSAHAPDGRLISGQLETGVIVRSTTRAMTGTMLFYFDQSLDINFTTNVFAMTGFYDSYFGPTFIGEAQAGFGHTATLTGITAVDASGSVISGITITAESGTLYPLAAVPEPPSAALSGVGVIVLLGAAPRRGLRVSRAVRTFSATAALTL